MRNRGRNYSRKTDRVSPGYSVRTKSGSWKTLYRYGKWKFRPTAAFSTEVIISGAIAIIIFYLLQ